MFWRTMFRRVEVWRTGWARLEDQVGAVMKQRPEVATQAAPNERQVTAHHRLPLSSVTESRRSQTEKQASVSSPWTTVTDDPRPVVDILRDSPRKPDAGPATEIIGPTSASKGQNARGSSEAPHNLGGKLEELQTLLQQMEGIAGKGRRLLAWLGPQVDQSSSRIAELESMLDRWKSDARGGGTAA